MKPIIKDIYALEIFDSRGNPTLKVFCELENGIKGSACIPSGASTGKYEALELRDNDKKRFLGKGVLKAIKNIEEKIVPKLKGMDASNQREIDYLLIELDGTENKTNLGANAILGVSLACARASALFYNLPLYKYLGGLNACILPIPLLNIINGGVHADNPLDIQEFMIVPHGFESFKEAIRCASEVFHNLKSILKENKLGVSVGDEGGFAPQIENTEEAIKFIIRAIEKAGYKPSEEVSLALDCAASEFFDEEKEIYKIEGKELKREELISFYENLVNKYPIVLIEDGMAEEDWEGWKMLTERLGKKILLVGDDVFVTNKKRIEKGIKEKCANAVLIKLNQIGTLTETQEAIHLSHKNNYKTVVSHRSGETEDTFIADFAVAMETGFIKTGSVSRSERTAKYNRLIEIETEIKNPVYPGTEFLKVK
ncbi:MAG: phosphopyruvate hydratase [candidate division WOR-3 bacterium]